jgi:hypothetical protein
MVYQVGLIWSLSFAACSTKEAMSEESPAAADPSAERVERAAESGDCTSRNMAEAVRRLEGVEPRTASRDAAIYLHMMCPEHFTTEHWYWALRVQGASDADHEAAQRARDAACPGALEAWDTPMSEWLSHTQERYTTCKVGESGILTLEEFRAGPTEAGALGANLYRVLSGIDEENAKTLIRWAIGNPLVAGQRHYPALAGYMAAQSLDVDLPQLSSGWGFSGRTHRIVHLDPDGILTLDGERPIQELRPASHEDWKVLLVADASITSQTLLQAVQALADRGYETELLTYPKPPVSELDPIHSETLSLPEKVRQPRPPPEPEPEPDPAPSGKVGKADAKVGIVRSTSDDSGPATGILGALAEAGPLNWANKAEVQVTLYTNRIEVEADDEQWSEQMDTIGARLLTLQEASEAKEASVTLTVAPDVSVGRMIQVTDACPENTSVITYALIGG